MFFANPLFLIGLAAIAIPIAVHLFSFRRYRKVYFSNVDRISDLRDETRCQSQLRQYLLLAARILAIVFLVLAFAQPTLPLSKQTIAGETAVSIYVDNSQSMQNTDSEGPLLQTAKEKVREIVAAYKPSDRFQLLTNDMAGSQFRWLGRDELLLALDDVEISTRTLSLSEAASKQRDFLLQSGAQKRHSYMISDMQKTSADIASLPSDSTILATIVPLEASSVNNLFFDTLTLDAPAYYRGSPIALTATLHNAGSEPIEKATVRLFVDGQQRALASVDLPAEGTAEVPMSFVADSGGALHCYVETTDYPLTFDDRLFFSLNIAQSLHVLLSGKENSYFAKLFTTDSAIVFSHVDARGIDLSRLADNDLIILNQFGDIPSGLASAVQNYVADGGTVLVVPAPEADVQSYNAMLAAMQAPQLGAWNASKANVASLSTEASLYRGVFSGKSTEAMELPSVSGHYSISMGASSVAEPLMTLATGQPCLTLTDHGSGRLYLASFPIETEYTDFAQQALFVPTFYNMALYSRPAAMPYYPFDYGEPIPVALAGAEQGRTHLSLVGSDYDVIPDLRNQSGRQAMTLLSPLAQPGNYLLATAGSAVGQAFSFNYSSRESSMDFYSPSEVARLLRNNGREQYNVVRNSEKSIEQYVKHMTDGRQLWRWCVVIALLMLAAEIVILRWPQPSRKNNKADQSL